jgi:hypothetical protein
MVTIQCLVLLVVARINTALLDPYYEINKVFKQEIKVQIVGPFQILPIKK